jgi:hypothetical protein
MAVVYLAGAFGVIAQEAPAEAAEPMAALQGSEPVPARERWEIDWDAPVTLGIFSGDEGVFGQADLLLPFYRYDKGLLFFSPRVSVSDSNQEETNLGVGLRHLVDARFPFILGANLYYDGRWSSNNNRFDQLGLGLELLSSRIDLRANYYLPEQDKYRIDSVRGESVMQYERISQSIQADAWFEPYALNNQIVQDYGNRITTRRTLVTETSWQIFDRYEAALEGFDAEAGWRLPWVEEWADTRLFIGYQYFENPFGRDLKGAKGRLEVRLFNDLLTLDAHLYEDEDLNLTDYLVGARLRLPLGLPGKPAWRQGNGGDLSARLTEMVMRDPKIQTRESKFIANPEQKGVITESQTRVSREVNREGTAVIVDDVVFVDGSRGNDANNGTTENPLATIQAGVDSAYGQRNVYVYAGTYNTVVNVTEGVSLMGSGCLIPANGGHSFGSGVHPVINGGGAVSVVTMQDNTLIQGFEIVNAGAGNGVFSEAGNLVIRCNYIHDTLVGVRVDRVGDLNLLLENNRFMNNGMAGAWISGTGASGTYFVNARGNTFTANGARGLHLTADNYDAALAIVHGSGAFENETGIDVEMNSNSVSLLSITDTRADNNTGTGIRADVNADDIADALIGTPAALLGLAGNVVGLPPEFEALLASSGPVTANNNDGRGLDINVQGGIIGAAALFNISASDNGAKGANVEVEGGSAAIGLLARTEALDNGGDGISMSVDGTSLGLGVLLDVRASNNAGNGIDLGVYSEGTAIGLIASTDPLRTLADIINEEAALNPPLVIPGEPWGPIEASGNGGYGVYAEIEGANLAAGVFLDIRADNNQNTGFSADIWSANGTAIGLAGSSDALFEVVPPILGDILYGDPDAIPVPNYTPMGPMTASGNGNGGFGLWVDGENAFGLVGGIEASGNDLGTDYGLDNYGYGLHLDVMANYDAFAALYDVTANNNAEQGIDVYISSSQADGSATLSLIGVQTENNAEEGIRIGASAWDDVYVLATGIESHDNGDQGIRIDAESVHNEIGMAFSAINTTGNAKQGLLVNAVADEDVFVWIGDTGIDDFRTVFGSYDLLGASEALYYLMPGGPSSFSGNGDNGAELNLATTNGTLSISTIGNTFSDNTGAGLQISMVGTNGASLYGEGNVITENNSGVLVNAPTGAVLDFGGIVSTGQNSIYDNTMDLWNISAPGVTLFAQYNWWGGVAPSTSGDVNVDNTLGSDPNP